MYSVKMRICFVIFCGFTIILMGFAQAFTPVPVKQDHHVRMPGSQPPPEMNISIEPPNCYRAIKIRTKSSKIGNTFTTGFLL